VAFPADTADRVAIALGAPVTPENFALIDAKLASISSARPTLEAPILTLLDKIEAANQSLETYQGEGSLKKVAEIEFYDSGDHLNLRVQSLGNLISKLRNLLGLLPDELVVVGPKGFCGQIRAVRG